MFQRLMTSHLTIPRNKHNQNNLNAMEKRRLLTGQSQRTSLGFFLPLLRVSTPYSPPSTATTIKTSPYDKNSGKATHNPFNQKSKSILFSKVPYALCIHLNSDNKMNCTTHIGLNKCRKFNKRGKTN